MEFELVRLEKTDGQGIVGDWNFRVRKFNRTTHSINGTGTLLRDVDETYELSITYAYSSLGNNQFNEYPMKMPRKKVCRYMVEEYRDLQHIWRDNSNLPQVEKLAAEFCPFPRGTYWVRDLAPDATWLPPVVPSGLWRMTVTVWRGADDPVMLIVFYFKITRKLMI